MLEEFEWVQIAPLLDRAITRTKELRANRHLPIKEALVLAQGEALQEYKRITGFNETNVNALWHHRLSLYGPPCLTCGKPLRTPLARNCAECGAAHEAV